MSCLSTNPRLAVLVGSAVPAGARLGPEVGRVAGEPPIPSDGVVLFELGVEYVRLAVGDFLFSLSWSV